jgi:hypothetical protein
MTRPFDPRPKIRTDYLAAFAVTLAPLVYFFNALRLGLVLSPDDGVAFNVPLRVAAANLIRAGYLPLWNPYIFCGMPLHGASQAGVLFPLNWFYLAFSPPVATNLMMFLTYAAAGLGAYLYARRAGSDIAGAIATSLIWQWSAILVEHIGHTNILHTAALLPWVLWAIDVYAATGSRKRGVVLAALLALQMFAGHQQTFVYSLLLVTAYAIVMAITDIRLRRRYLSSLAFIAAGVFLAAVQILPTFELLRNSLRATATYEFFGLFSMPPYFVLTFLAPYVLGGGNGFLFRAPYTGPQFFGEYVAYVGVLTIMLAFVAVILKRDARTKFWGLVFVIALLMAFGRFLPLGLYHLVYYVPVINLFRSPARHLMEVEFALAVLAGRGLTALNASRGRGAWRNTAITSMVGGTVFLLTCLTVTWWRPASFQLGREAPVSILRAPELFVPIIIAALSAVALWMFARSGRRRAVVLMLAVLSIDLILYGQGSGWRTHSPGRESELWAQTASVKFLSDRKTQSQGVAYRILTQDQPFDPDFPVAAASPGSEGGLSLQPDMYMMHGIENAAGYDGFGLARYSRLAGDMKIWGELPYPDRTLLGDSREIDLLNVRYLLTRSGAVTKSPATSASSSEAFPPATQVYAGHRFGTEVQLPGNTAGHRVSFNVPPTEVDRIALITNMSWSENVPDRTVVAHVRINSLDGQAFDFELRAGDHTSEWAYDRPDIRSRIKHKRAPVATTHEVQDARGKYEAHTYVSSFRLPQKTMVTSGSITVVPIKSAPELSLSLTRIALAEGERAFPLTREMVKKEIPTESSGSGSPVPAGAARPIPHWKRVGQLSDVAIFENTRALPRAWLATEAQVLPDPEILEVIRKGKLPDGRPWEPERVALVESPLNFKLDARDDAASAEVTSHEPNRVMVKAKSAAPAILVLSENHYPGWRAYVDGRAVETLRVNYNLRGVTLPAGNHTVEFIYRPKAVFIGAAISVLTLIMLLLWCRRLLPEQRVRRVMSSFVKRTRPESSAGIQREV